MTIDALVVEDDAPVRRLVATVLERAGFRVHQAATPEEAIALAAAVWPDVVILDHQLHAGRTGLDLALDLRERLPRAHLVLFTAFLDGIEAGRAPVDACIDKSRLFELTEVVRRLLGKQEPTGPSVACVGCHRKVALRRTVVRATTRELECPACGTVQVWAVTPDHAGAIAT